MTGRSFTAPGGPARTRCGRTHCAAEGERAAFVLPAGLAGPGRLGVRLVNPHLRASVGPRPLGESRVVRVGSHGRVSEPDGLKIRPGGWHSLWGESYPRSTGDDVEDGQAIVHLERTRPPLPGVGEDPVKRPPARSSRGALQRNPLPLSLETALRSCLRSRCRMSCLRFGHERFSQALRRSSWQPVRRASAGTSATPRNRVGQRWTIHPGDAAPSLGVSVLRMATI